MAHLDALDNKAGIVLGFAGLLITLAPDAPVGFRLVAVMAGAASIAFALASFWPRVGVADPRRVGLGTGYRGGGLVRSDDMAEQKVEDTPEVPPPPPRQPDESLKGYIERGNTSRPARDQGSKTAN